MCWITAVSDQPDLAPLVARWRVEAFFAGPGGYTVAEMTRLILAPGRGPEETFVLFEGGRPVGTAGLVRQDLDARRDLSPWLAGVFVVPGARGRGHAASLVRQVEAHAAGAGVGVLWLYTAKGGAGAGALYRRLGWEHAGVERDDGVEVSLMRRRLGGA